MRADTRRVLAELRHQVETGHPDLSRPPTAAAKEAPLCGPLGPGVGVSSQGLDRPAVLYHSLMPADSPRVSPGGHHVCRWRAIRRMSQLDLAAADTTPRHLSVKETGRSRPGKDLILRIAGALTVPAARDLCGADTAELPCRPGRREATMAARAGKARAGIPGVPSLG
jgi:hypothetical protein